MVIYDPRYGYDRRFIVLSTVIMIVNYNCKTFIVPATTHGSTKLFLQGN